MKRIAALFGFVACAGLLLLWTWADDENNVPWVRDPAVVYHTRGNSSGYGYIDRWASYGMKIEAVIGQLSKEGYACSPLPVAKNEDEELKGLHTVSCSRRVNWPLMRTVTLKLKVDYDMHGRLVAAEGRSQVAAGLGPVGGVLRQFGKLEPETLQVKGLAYDSAELLARQAVDAIKPGGWYDLCSTDLPTESDCAKEAVRRRSLGLPALPAAPAEAMGLKRVVGVFEQLRLLSRAPQNHTTEPTDVPALRVEDGRMWMDFSTRDLTGKVLKVAVEVDSEGGKPVKLIASVGADNKEVLLNGRLELANNDVPMFLLPKAAEVPGTRIGVWVALPAADSNDSVIYNAARAMLRIEPRFSLRVFRAMLQKRSAGFTPDEWLGLYPKLNSIESLAVFLARVRADRWLPNNQDVALIKAEYADKPEVRAAWALAACARSALLQQISADCLARFTFGDGEMSVFMRKEIAVTMVQYAELPAHHPVQVRLQLLSALFPGP